MEPVPTKLFPIKADQGCTMHLFITGEPFRTGDPDYLYQPYLKLQVVDDHDVAFFEILENSDCEGKTEAELTVVQCEELIVALEAFVAKHKPAGPNLTTAEALFLLESAWQKVFKIAAAKPCMGLLEYLHAALPLLKAPTIVCEGCTTRSIGWQIRDPFFQLAIMQGDDSRIYFTQVIDQGSKERMLELRSRYAGGMPTRARFPSKPAVDDRPLRARDA